MKLKKQLFFIHTLAILAFYQKTYTKEASLDTEIYAYVLPQILKLKDSYTVKKEENPKITELTIQEASRATGHNDSDTITPTKNKNHAPAIHIHETEDYFICTAKHPGNASVDIKTENKKTTRETMYVAYPTIHDLPKKLTIGDKLYLEKVDTETPLKQTNLQDDDAGNISISSKKSNNHSFWKLTIKDSGPIALELGDEFKRIEALEPDTTQTINNISPQEVSKDTKKTSFIFISAISVMNKKRYVL